MKWALKARKFKTIYRTTNFRKLVERVGNRSLSDDDVVKDNGKASEDEDLSDGEASENEDVVEDEAVEDMDDFGDDDAEDVTEDDADTATFCCP